MRVDGKRVDPGEVASSRATRQSHLHVPVVGSKLSVTLPKEITRATVTEVLGPNELVVKLDVQEPMAKTHQYHFGDELMVRRRLGLGDLVVWEATGKV